MFRVCSALVALLFLATVDQASAGELRRETLASPALGRSADFLVYVPDGYDSTGLYYPVLYLLHGAGGDETVWAERGRIAERVDRLIAARELPPTLVVMPECRACWWVDGARDQAETYFWTELVPAVAERYRAIETRDGRLVAGLSAGGYGAVRFALKYPDRVAAVAAFSPAVYATTPPAASSARVQPPFLGPDGSFSQDAWTARNYPQLTAAYLAQPLRVPMYLVSGDNDRLGLAFETALLFKRMFDQQPGITELRIVDGDHDWAVWSAAVDDAMKYVYRFALRPATSSRPPPRPPQIAVARPN